MQIKDLVGFSKPLTRLIEVVSQGIGAVSRPYLIRKCADAKAHEVRVIAAAIKEVAELHHLPVVFKDGEVDVWQTPEDRTLLLDQPDFAGRSDRRVDYQERKRQGNVESITAVAAVDLLEQSEVPEEQPDEDWINRFFRAAEDVSSEQMQELWGRILAGEIKKPGSYSLKTLDFVKNLTKSDASLLEKVASLAVSYAGSSVVPTPNLEWLKRERGIYPGHHFEASELGAMYPTDLNYRTFREPETTQEHFSCGKRILLIDRGTITAEINLPVWQFTKIGREILQLIPTDGDQRNLQELGLFFVQRGATAKLAEITAHLPDGRIEFKNAQNIEAPDK